MLSPETVILPFWFSSVSVLLRIPGGTAYMSLQWSRHGKSLKHRGGPIEKPPSKVLTDLSVIETPHLLIWLEICVLLLHS